ncbi:hypothetical protein BBK82_05945 [Lentzea guizhouensis]|uniref:Uncharacterized protein n=1 Tax=Lentzea guizhouensis TaxID=1586287 RepID=A0A1B2HD87_9PSEU|nr:hypothetical protein [Lentzea guizhouensis]ANZ35690.1 hypothetical protein BBK82_05945 [Lentzea guizhouensis]
MSTWEVAVPELATMSITVTLAPRVRCGLHALLHDHLTRLSVRPAGEPGGGTVNQVTGTVIGTVIQARDINGDVNLGNKPFWRR